MKFPGLSKETEKGIALRPGHVNKKIIIYVVCTVHKATLTLDNHICNKWHATVTPREEPGLGNSASNIGYFPYGVFAESAVNTQ